MDASKVDRRWDGCIEGGPKVGWMHRRWTEGASKGNLMWTASGKDASKVDSAVRRTPHHNGGRGLVRLEPADHETLQV